MVTSSDRVMAKATLGKVVRWEFPDLDEMPGSDDVSAVEAPAAGDALRQQLSLLRALIAALGQADRTLDDEVISGVTELAVEVTRRLRRGQAGSEPLLDAMDTLLGGLPVGSST